VFYPGALLQKLEELGSSPFQGTVFRHMLGQNVPAHINVRGARWNPPQTSAIYTSLERETALAEAEYHLSLQTPPMRVRRVLYSVHVSLQKVVDLRSLDVLSELSIPVASLASADLALCQRIGGAVARLGNDGLLVPSVRRAGGVNLVIYPTQQELTETDFRVGGEEVIETGRGHTA
jgi:RES domain-containing protein